MHVNARYCLPLAMSVSLLLAGCPNPGQGVSSSDSVKIGFMGPLTGPDASVGVGAANAVELAIKQINAAGGVNGKPLELILRDDTGDPDRGIEVAKDLLPRGVAAIIGPLWSGVSTKVIEQVLKPAGIPAVSPAATSPALATVDDGGLFFRTIPSDALQGKAISRQIQEDGYRKITVFHIDTAYGRGLADTLVADFAATQGNTAAKVSYPEATPPDYAQSLRSHVANDTEAIVLIGYHSDGAQLFKDWSNVGPEGVKWYFSEIFHDSTFAERTGIPTKLEGFKGTTPHTVGPHFASFKADYAAEFGTDPGLYAANAYDATMLAALSMVQAGANTKEAVKQHLVALSQGGTKQTGSGIAGFKDAVSKIKAGTDLDYEGTSGSVDMDAHGELQHGSYVIWSWKSGKPVDDLGKIWNF